MPDDPAFETYVTAHNGANRVRSDLSGPQDAAILAQFEDADPQSPAGYRSLIALNEATYSDDVSIEVIAQVDGSGPTETVTRVLRLTADQAPLAQVPGTTGRYFLRGDNFSWVTIDDGPVLSGSDSRGLVDLVLDFDTGMADIQLRTGVAGTSQVRTEVVGTGLPFNIRNGAFGGAITVAIHDPDGPLVYAIDGSLRGNIGGDPGFSNSIHGLSGSGLYTATGTDQGATVTIDGAFAGVDPNALP
ncbi:viral aspartic protease [Oceaniglobus trochenteri]|uniref:viral aspartic protease n=1 Tax=Oceaniglobus trochenteri TaxID=2763260 RepID=UPI001CFF6F47|nr:viral aspartic protease [Oceaniglobus trochenteri]